MVVLRVVANHPPGLEDRTSAFGLPFAVVLVDGFDWRYHDRG